MKKLTLVLSALLISTFGIAQSDVSLNDGIYAYENGNLYNGKVVEQYKSGATQATYEYSIVQ